MRVVGFEPTCLRGGRLEGGCVYRFRHTRIAVELERRRPGEELNLQPTGYEPSALSIELPGLFLSKLDPPIEKVGLLFYGQNTTCRAAKNQRPYMLYTVGTPPKGLLNTARLDPTDWGVKNI